MKEFCGLHPKDDRGGDHGSVTMTSDSRVPVSDYF